jgi:hypothetical protein
MATNLRLSEDAAAAVRAEATLTGRSQQDVIRSAVDAYLSDPDRSTPAYVRRSHKSARDEIVAPRTPFKTLPKQQRLKLPDGVTFQQLIDDQREDRF